MKRSEMIEKLHQEIQDKWDIPFGEYTGGWESYKEFYSDILNIIQSEGMLPPSVPAKVFTPDFPWGGGCSMRCNCEQCNPEYPVNKWEKE